MAKSVLTDDAYERTRENMEEFGRSKKAGKLLQTIFRSLLVNATVRDSNDRLMKLGMKVIQSDPVNDRGKHLFGMGNINLLEGFNFNSRARLSDILYVRYHAVADKAAGQVSISIPGFIPRQSLQRHPDASHFRIVAAAAAVDFESGKYEYVQQSTADLEITHSPIEAISFVLTLPANTHPVLLGAMRVEYFTIDNGKLYQLKDASYNPMELVLAVK